MSIDKLPENPRAYWRNDLRGELNAIANRNAQCVQGIGLTLGPKVLGLCPVDGCPHLEGPLKAEEWPPANRVFSIGIPLTNGWHCTMPWQVFEDLVDHERRFGRRSRLKEDDRQLSGVELLRDYSWPRCHGCSLVFATILQGDVGGRGYWVNRIEDGAYLCESCWLAEHYNGDCKAMIEHVLAHDIGDDSRWIRVELRRGRGLDIVTVHIERSYWHSPGLRELIRLHRVSLADCADVIVRTVTDMVRKVRREEREPNSRRATVSNSLNCGTRGSA